MNQYAYSPDTGELIHTDTPAHWMGLTDAIPPDFNPETAGCFWRNEQWEIVAAQPETPQVPKFVSMRQARLALLQHGLLDMFDAAMTTPQDRIWWDFSDIVERQNTMVLAKTVAVGLTPNQVDDLFVLAATF